MKDSESGILFETLYNPQRLDRERLIQTFTARHSALDELVRGVRTQPAGGPYQHWLLTGGRGMGKTTLLARLRHAIEDDPQLSRVWEPVAFAEENYNVGDLAELWLSTLRAIGASSGDAEPGSIAEELIRSETSTDLLEAKALDALRARVRRTQRRLLLLLDNVDRILEQISDERQHYRLRAVLMEDPTILIVGAALGRPAAIAEYDGPFYEFFRELRLRGLSEEELMASLRARAEALGDRAILDSMRRSPGRVEGLRRLTGGSPRLGQMIYRLLREAPRRTLRQDLDVLLEEATPAYRDRLEALPAQGRRVFDAVARSWDPVLARDVAQRTRLPVGSVSTQLVRLTDRGYVEETEGTGARKEFQVSERFLNLHYLLRYDPPGRARIGRLARFMEAFYGIDAEPDTPVVEGVTPVSWTRTLATADRLLRLAGDKLREADSRRLRVVVRAFCELASSGHAKEAGTLLDERGAADVLEPLRHALAVESGDDPQRCRRIAVEIAGVAQDVLTAIRRPLAIREPPNQAG